MRNVQNWLAICAIAAMTLFGAFFLYKTWNRPPDDPLCQTTAANFPLADRCKNANKPWWY